jgi:hypothetical protein
MSELSLTRSAVVYVLYQYTWCVSIDNVIDRWRVVCNNGKRERRPYHHHLAALKALASFMLDTYRGESQLAMSNLLIVHKCP